MAKKVKRSQDSSVIGRTVRLNDVNGIQPAKPVIDSVGKARRQGAFTGRRIALRGVSGQDIKALLTEKGRADDIQARILSFQEKKTGGIRDAKMELRRLVNRLPADRLEEAVTALQGLLKKKPIPSTAPTGAEAGGQKVQIASDAEVAANGDLFIARYKVALERLAK